MKLNPKPFEMIKSGRKTIELRLFDEKRQKIKVGVVGIEISQPKLITEEMLVLLSK